MEKQNYPRSAIKHSTPKKSFGSRPLVSFADTSGSSPINFSNTKRNVTSPKKRQRNRKQMADKSVQTDAIHHAALLEELKMKTDFLTENIKFIFESLEPSFKENAFSMTSNENISNEVTSEGDVNNKDGYECPAFWLEINPYSSNHTSSEAERPETNKEENTPDMLKDKLNQLLDCAFKIKNAISAKHQDPYNETTTDASHIPTRVIPTPTTQTEPVDTYFKFLQVIDEAAGRKSEPIDIGNKSTRHQTSPRLLRKRISNKSHAGHHHKVAVKGRSTNTGHRRSNNCLDIDMEESLNRRGSPILPKMRRNVSYLDDTVVEDISGQAVKDIQDERSSEYSRIKGELTNTGQRNSIRSLEIDLNKSLNRSGIPNLSMSRKLLDLDGTVAADMSGQTVKEFSDKQCSEKSENSKDNLNLKSERRVKITKMISADDIYSSNPEKKNFCFKDYISVLREVNTRSPATKRIREFRARKYFDFDDYYEKLINMHHKCKSI